MVMIWVLLDFLGHILQMNCQSFPHQRAAGFFLIVKLFGHFRSVLGQHAFAVLPGLSDHTFIRFTAAFFHSEGCSWYQIPSESWT